MPPDDPSDRWPSGGSFRSSNCGLRGKCPCRRQWGSGGSCYVSLLRHGIWFGGSVAESLLDGVMGEGETYGRVTSCVSLQESPRNARRSRKRSLDTAFAKYPVSETCAPCASGCLALTTQRRHSGRCAVSLAAQGSVTDRPRNCSA
jgi:hypothetical protein